MLLDYNADRQTINIVNDENEGRTTSEVFVYDTKNSGEKIYGKDEALIYFSTLGKCGSWLLLIWNKWLLLNHELAGPFSD